MKHDALEGGSDRGMCMRCGARGVTRDGACPGERCPVCRVLVGAERFTLTLYGRQKGKPAREAYTGAWVFCSRACRDDGRKAMQRLIAQNRSLVPSWDDWEMRPGDPA